MPSRILAVDDNPRNLAILRLILEPEFEVETVRSGEEALELAPRFRPDMVLLDIVMPGLDGYETCRRLRGLSELSSAKIIMVSAKGMASERMEGYVAGADDYMVKPFDHDEMLAKLRVYLRLKSVQEVDHLKSELLTLLSHETRTPLSQILGPIPMLRSNPNLSDEERELLTIMELGARSLLALIEKVSFFHQLKMGALSLAPLAIDLGVIAREVSRTAGQKAEKANVRLLVEVDEAGARVHGDPERLRWVVEVLLDNAIRLTPAGRTVDVRVRTEGGRSYLEVTDQGPGIEPELLARIFDGFVVADLAHHTSGQGLNLATARLIADMHGGRLGAESRVGCGSTFVLELATEAAEAAA